jgi:hypothetical protein
MEGPYSTTPEAGERVEGEVIHKPGAVNYIPAKRVIYSFRHRKPDTAFFELNSFQTMFTAGDTSRRVLSATDDSVAEEAPTYQFIGIGFGDDPAVIPKGTWHLIRIRTGKDLATVDYDDNGNAILLRYLDDDGSVMKEAHFPACGKRKMVRRDPNGMGAEQICPLEIP